MGITESDKQRLEEDHGTAEHISELEKDLAVAQAMLKEREGLLAGAREQIDAAEKGFRQALKERDEHKASADVWRKRVWQAAESLADVLPGEVGRLDLLSRIHALKDAVAAAQVMLARLKPSGQVAEDVSFLDECIGVSSAHWSQPRVTKAMAALSRLAAKAQDADRLRAIIAYIQECEGGPHLLTEAGALAADRQDEAREEREAAVERASELDWVGAVLIAQLRAERDDARHQLGEAGMLLLSRTDERDEARGAMRLAAGERDAAVADNAELLAHIVDELGHDEDCEYGNLVRQSIMGRCPAPEASTCTCIIGRPHPGAALLEELMRLREHARLATDHATSCARERISTNEQHRKEVEEARVSGRQALRKISEVLTGHGAQVSDQVSLTAIINALDAVVAQARNEGLEEAASVCETMGRAFVSFRSGMARCAKKIRAKKTCTDASCAKCRSGEPCR